MNLRLVPSFFLQKKSGHSLRQAGGSHATRPTVKTFLKSYDYHFPISISGSREVFLHLFVEKAYIFQQ